MSLGPPEILVILVLALILFGPKRLPEVGRQVAGAVRELRRMQDTLREELDLALDHEPATAAPPTLPAADGPAAPAEPEADHPAGTGEQPTPDAPPREPGFEGPSGSFL